MATTEVVTARFSREQRRLIDAAAALGGITRAAFVRLAVLAAARAAVAVAADRAAAGS